MKRNFNHWQEIKYVSLPYVIHSKLIKNELEIPIMVKYEGIILFQYS